MPTCSYPSSPLISRCPYMHFPTLLLPQAVSIDRGLDFPQGFRTFVYVFAFLSFRVPSVIFKSCFLKHPTVGPGRGAQLARQIGRRFMSENPFAAIFTSRQRKAVRNIVFTVVFFQPSPLQTPYLLIIICIYFFHSRITPHLNWIDIVPDSKEI